MTEKRFTAFTDFLGGTQTILDNGERKTLQELIDTMNGLAEENEQLKSKNRGLQSELGIFKEDVTHSNQIINKLNDENEQLKKQIQQLQHWNKCLAEKRHQELKGDVE